MLAAVPLCGGGEGLGDALVMPALVFLVVAAVAIAGVVLALVSVARWVGGVAEDFAAWQARRPKREPPLPKPLKPMLRMTCAPSGVNVRWRGPWPTRLTADDGGLRVTGPLRKPRLLDADAVQQLHIEPRGGVRHQLVVETRDGSSWPCGRPAHYADLERVREALTRALRLAPHDRFTSTVSMA